MPESLCGYLVNGEQCNYNLVRRRIDLPSGSIQNLINEDWFGPDKLPTGSTRWCYLAKPLSTINTIGKAQADCNRFEPSQNLRPWEQLV